MTQEELDKVIDNTNVRVKENLLYTVAMMMDVMMRDLDWDLKMLSAIVRENKILFEPKKRKAFRDYMNTTLKLKVDFEKTFDKDMDEDMSWERKEITREDANEFLRLFMLYIDRCSDNPDNANAVHKFLRSMPEGGIFPESQIDRFRLK